MKCLKASENRIVAIDPSPRGTGIVVMDDGELRDYWYCTKTKRVAKKDQSARLVPEVHIGDENLRMKRLEIILGLVTEVVATYNPSHIGIEDYVLSAGKKGGGTIQIAELGGILRYSLWVRNRKIRTYHPSSVKLFWTGKGNADKNMMVEHTLKRLDDDQLPKFKKLSTLAQEAISDAFAVGSLLWEEIRFRRGLWVLNEADENVVRVFNRVTETMPTCLIDRPWMQRED